MASIPAWIPNSAVVQRARERAGEYGVDLSKYTDKQVIDFIKFIPQKEADEFERFYDLRPDKGTPQKPESIARNIREFTKQQKMIRDLMDRWRKECEKREGK